jgi:predicted ATP-grasp superfamily ATP-dependent carboligase
VRLFVSEYVCSGAWPERELPPSLAREGRAMLLALLADLAAVPGLSLCTTWDARLGEFPSMSAVACASPLNVDCMSIQRSADESGLFRRLARDWEATYVIAPELDDSLTGRVQAVLDVGGRSLNATPDAIAACSDKWETFRRLSAAGIPTVPTARFDSGVTSLPFDAPIVLKPRFGAGSQHTFLIHDVDQLRAAAAHFPADKPTAEAVFQPYIVGKSRSVAAIFHSDGTLRELWPIGEQRLSDDGRFTYLGGRLPMTRSEFGSRISDLIRQFSRVIAGLHGYIGFDVIVPEQPDATPLIVDINPRLTTSYLGYRALSDINLAGRILWPDGDWPSLDWRGDVVEFDAHGSIARSSSSRG